MINKTIREKMCILDDFPTTITKSGNIKIHTDDHNDPIIFDIIHELRVGDGYVHLDGSIYHVESYKLPTRALNSFILYVDKGGN